ncbi:uncharacterized protein VP01_1892g6, partial [Puccinia sorghi]
KLSIWMPKKALTRTQTQTQLQQNPEVINLDAKEGSDKNSNPNLVPAQQSWVWTHFCEMEDGAEAVFQVLVNTNICGRMIRKDQSGSTKGFHEHLMRVH